MEGLRTALAFLTVLPLPAGPAGMREPGRAAAWFPIVGLGIGAVIVVVHAAGAAVLTPWLAAIATVATWAIITGFLHLDGVADCGDGLLVAATPERRLEIMRDPRVGTFGAVVLILFIAAKIAAIAALSDRPAVSAEIVVVLLLAPATARWLLLVVAAILPPARPGGMGDAFRTGLSRRALALGAVVPVVLAAAGALPGVIAVGAGIVAAASVAELARRRLGGATGDVLGLVVESVELAILVVYPAVLS